MSPRLPRTFPHKLWKSFTFLQLDPGSAWSASGRFPESNKKTENSDVLVYHVLFWVSPKKRPKSTKNDQNIRCLSHLRFPYLEGGRGGVRVGRSADSTVEGLVSKINTSFCHNHPSLAATPTFSLGVCNPTGDFHTSNAL